MLCKKLFLSSIAIFVLLSFPIINAVGASLEMWSKTYGGKSEDIAYSLVETSDGGYAIAGYTGSFGAGGDDFWLVKTDAEGNMEWNQTYGGRNNDIAYSLVETSDGGYAIAGCTLSFGAGSHDFWLVKTDAYGIPEFPSWAILPLFLTATLVVAIYSRNLSKTSIQTNILLP